MASNIQILRATSMSQGNYKNTVSKNIQQAYQDIIYERFTYASDYMVIQEEIGCGSQIFKDIGVRLTHAISTGMGDNFAKECKKVIFQQYDHEQYLGKKYKIGSDIWLTTDLNEVTNVSSHSFIRKCNNVLNWINPQNSEEVFSEPCVFTKQFSNTSFDEGNKGVIQISGDFMVLVQANERTKTIDFNQRFVMNGLGFQISQYDNHRADTYLIFKMKQIDVQANDNTKDNIANDTTGKPQTGSQIKILPQVIKILQGVENLQNFTVYNYIDGMPNKDEFTITAEGPSQDSYILDVDGTNSFTITNVKESSVPLVVKCINNTTLEETTITLVLGGLY